MTSARDFGRDIRLGTAMSIQDWQAARCIAREHMDVNEGDAKRLSHDADRIRRALALTSCAGDTIEMQCFNSEEADKIALLLTAEESVRVTLTWRFA